MTLDDLIGIKLQLRHIPMSFQKEQVDTCLAKVLEDLNTKISRYSVQETIDSRSVSVRDVLKKCAQEIVGLAWVKTPVTSLRTFSSFGMPTAIFQLDGTFACQRKCGVSHTADFVVCLNNREAIGTSFLKLETSHIRRVQESQDSLDFNEFNTSVLITLSRTVLELGKWDAAYGDSFEHQEAFQKAYRGVLSSNFVLLELGIE